MPRPIHIADPLFRLYLREAGFTNAEEMVTRGILNRWHAYLSEGCTLKCCSHRPAKPVKVNAAKRADVVDYRFHLKAKGDAVATTNNVLVKLRKFYDWMLRTKEMKKGLENPCAQVKGDKPQKNLQPVMRPDDAVFAAILKACDDSPDETVARRDRAIISMLMWSGLRREEITKLDRSSYNEDTQRPMVKVGTVQRTTKKRIARWVPLAPDTAKLLDLYLIRRDEGYSVDPDSPLFMSQRGDRLTAAGVSQLFDRKKKAAGITGPLGLHSTRRGWTITARRAGMSDSEIMRIAGWSSDLMIRHYSQDDDKDIAYDAYFTKMAPLADTKPKVKGAKPGRYGKRAA